MSLRDDVIAYALDGIDGPEAEPERAEFTELLDAALSQARRAAAAVGLDALIAAARRAGAEAMRKALLAAVESVMERSTEPVGDTPELLVTVDEFCERITDAIRALPLPGEEP